MAAQTSIGILGSGGEFGPSALISAGALQIIRFMTLIGRVNNSYIEAFLRSQPKFLDLDYVKFDLLKSINSELG
jgi:hypothetical protein